MSDAKHVIRPAKTLGTPCTHKHPIFFLAKRVLSQGEQSVAHDSITKCALMRLETLPNHTLFYHMPFSTSVPAWAGGLGKPKISTRTQRESRWERNWFIQAVSNIVATARQKLAGSRYIRCRLPFNAGFVEARV